MPGLVLSAFYALAHFLPLCMAVALKLWPRPAAPASLWVPPQISYIGNSGDAAQQSVLFKSFRGFRGAQARVGHSCLRAACLPLGSTLQLSGELLCLFVYLFLSTRFGEGIPTDSDLIDLGGFPIF